MEGWEVRVEGAGDAWQALLVDDAGSVLLERRFETEARARLFASTVEQHLGWLSEARFREYYRL